MNVVRFILFRMSPFFILLMMGGCSRSERGTDTAVDPPSPTVSADGVTIHIPAGTPGLARFTTSTVKPGRVTISAIAPARVVASITPSVTDGERIVLFESSDITSLYSQYRQARSGVERAAKNLTRIREMYGNQGATAADLTNAESDAASAHAAEAEMEARLRAAGFNPLELESAPVNCVWLICDVPETELSEVQKGETVDVLFSSLPGKTLVGRATAVGDIVDPVTRTVKVRVSMQSPREKLLPGMFARVDFGDPRDGVILIPNSAVVTVEEKDFVFVQTSPGEFQRRAVIVQSANASNQIVLQGLQPGDNVVVTGALLLKGMSFGF
jgi:membrane fusion protein, heavy metal efflux system